MASTTAKYIAEQLRAQQPEPSPAQKTTSSILGAYKQGLQQIRSNRNMHPDRKRIEAAQLYTTTRQALAKTRADQTEADQADYARLERKLFGYGDMRSLLADNTSMDATIRDAQDRAAQLKNQGDAARALQQAELSGDRVLARAIFKRAHDHDWDDVVGEYLDTRPRAAEMYQEAGTIWHRYNATGGQLHESMNYVVHKPEELRGVSDKDIDAMVNPSAESAA